MGIPGWARQKISPSFTRTQITCLPDIAASGSNVFFGEKGNGESVVIDADGVTEFSNSLVLGDNVQQAHLEKARARHTLCGF